MLESNQPHMHTQVSNKNFNENLNLKRKSQKVVGRIWIKDLVEEKEREKLIDPMARDLIFFHYFSFTS